MVSDLLSPLESDEYWGVSMPYPVGDAADIVLFEESRSLQAASLAALVYMLTDPQAHITPKCDGDLLHTFLFCFRSFCDPVELAKALISRLEERPRTLNSSQCEAWPYYHSSVKSRVWHLINAWIDEYWIHEKDRIAGLHIKDLVSQSPGESELEEKDELVRKLDERREAAISLAPSGDSAEEESQPEATLSSSRRIACRQKPIRYNRKLQQRVNKHVQNVPQRTPTEADFRSASELDDLIQSMDGGVHILQLNSRELCQETARQLAIFMSEGYRRVIPEDLWYRHYGLGHDGDGDISRSTQQAYESALSSWVTGSILSQSAPIPRAAVTTFFIALALVRFLQKTLPLLCSNAFLFSQRSHAERNFSAMLNIYDGLTHPCLELLSEARLVGSLSPFSAGFQRIYFHVPAPERNVAYGTGKVGRSQGERGCDRPRRERNCRVSSTSCSRYAYAAVPPAIISRAVF
jgi:RasGEF N-terminal motif/RasGEF domain